MLMIKELYLFYSEDEAIAEVDQYMTSNVEYLALIFEDVESNMGKEVSNNTISNLAYPVYYIDCNFY